jgi:hypothetical protein
LGALLRPFIVAVYTKAFLVGLRFRRSVALVPDAQLSAFLYVLRGDGARAKGRAAEQRAMGERANERASKGACERRSVQVKGRDVSQGAREESDGARKER